MERFSRPYVFPWAIACKEFPREEFNCGRVHEGGGSGDGFAGAGPRDASSLPEVQCSFKDTCLLGIGSVTVAASALADGKPAAVLYTMSRFAVNALEVAAYLQQRLQWLRTCAAKGDPVWQDALQVASVFASVMGVTTRMPKPPKAKYAKQVETAHSVLAALALAAQSTHSAQSTLAAQSTHSAQSTLAAQSTFCLPRLVMRRVHLVNRKDVCGQIRAGLAVCAAAHLLELHHGDVTVWNVGTLEAGGAGGVLALDFELSTWRGRASGALEEALGSFCEVQRRMVLDSAVWFDFRTSRVFGCVEGGAPHNARAIMDATFIPNWDLAYFTAGMASMYPKHPTVSALVDAVFHDVTSAKVLDAVAPAMKLRGVRKHTTPLLVLHSLFKFQTPGAQQAVDYFVRADAMDRAMRILAPV